MPYRDVMAEAADVGPDGQHGQGEPVSRSAFLPALTPEFARDAAALLESGLVYFFQLRTMGGAISDVAPDATAFAHRSSKIMVNVAALYQDPAEAPAHEEWATEFAAALRQSGQGGAYVNFLDEKSEAGLREAYPGSTLERLRQVKAKYDPTNLFRLNHNIPPAA